VSRPTKSNPIHYVPCKSRPNPTQSSPIHGSNPCSTLVPTGRDRS